MTELRIEIPRGFEVHGRVIDEFGDGVPGATVVMSGYGDGGYVKDVAEADSRGRFRIRDVSTGHRLSERAVGYTPTARIPLRGMVPGQSYELDLGVLKGGRESSERSRTKTELPSAAHALLFRSQMLASVPTPGAVCHTTLRVTTRGASQSMTAASGG